MTKVSLANAKAHLSELLDRVEMGDNVEITRRGKTVARLVSAEKPRLPIDRSALKALTDAMPRSEVSAAEFVRAMRDDDRY